jgi:hypothetical protein
MTSRPKQALPFAEKDEEWKNNNVIYHIGRCNIYPVTNTDAATLYAAAAGKLDEKLYTYVTNPLNMERPELKGYPSKMRNIDIISPNIQSLMGELNERFFEPIVIIINENVNNRIQQAEFDLRLNQIKQEFINGLVQKGMMPEEIAQTPMPDEVVKKTVSNLKAEIAKIGQDAVNIILQDCKIDQIRRKTFYDFIVLGRFFTYRTVRNNNPICNWTSPMEISYPQDPNIDYVHDGQSVRRAVNLPFTTLVDMFTESEQFQKILPDVESTLGQLGYQTIFTGGLTTDMLLGISSNNYYNTQGEGVLLEHVQWKSLRMMKRVTGKDMFGNEYKEDYDETYEALPNEDVEIYWVNQTWEGYRINSKWIIDVQPLEFQMGTYDNPSSCKLEYNGRVFGNNYIVPLSHVEKGIVYQIKYNIAHYHLEKIMNKNKDKITFFPLGAIPKKEGWDEFTVMYYADAHGYFFLDETDPSVTAAMQYMKVLDMSLYQYIKEIYGVLRQIKEDWDESIGFNRQRRGQNMASDGKGVNEESIFRSALVSEEFFTQHEECIVEDLNYLMSISKAAWIEGKKGSYSTSEFKRVDYNIDPTIYPYSDLNIYVKNSGKVKREVDSMKNVLGTLAQQTQNFSILPKIVQATNMPKLIEQLEELEAALAKSQEAAQQAEQQKVQLENESKENDRQLKIYEIDEQRDGNKEIALINLQGKLLSLEGGDTNGDGKIDAKDSATIALQRMDMVNKLQLEREKLMLKNKEIDTNARVAREQMQTDLQKAAIAARKAKKAS